MIDAGGPLVVLQPVVDLATGRPGGRGGAQPVPGGWGKPPDVCLRRGAQRRARHRLELLALDRAAAHLDRVDGYVAMNVSPAPCSPRVRRAARAGCRWTGCCWSCPSTTRSRTTPPCRRCCAVPGAGLRLAIDDVGAGFSSLRHIVVTSPDVIKIDRSIVTGLTATRCARRWSARWSSSRTAATCGWSPRAWRPPAEAAVLGALGVDYGQGWHFGRPAPVETLGPTVDAGILPISA